MFAKAEGSVWEADVLGEQDIAREPSAPGPSGEPGTLGFVGETDRAREPSTPGPSGEPWNHRTIIRRAIQDCFKGFLDLTVMPTLASLGWKYLLGFSAIPVLVFTLCSFKKRRQPSKVNSTDIKSTHRMSYKKHEILKEMAKSVGYIYGGKEKGTCWRVGRDKIITAAHVVIGNIWNTVGKWENEAELNKIYIDFNYVEHKQVQQEFKVEPRVIYINKSLDVAVLQLKKHNSHEFPKALQLFHRLDRKKDLYRKLCLISHDKGQPKEFNYNIGIWTPTERKMADLKKFSEDYYQENGYIGLDNSDRLVIQCDFVTGASGSPGITFINDTPFVVLIYLCGFPGFYYGANFPQTKKNKFPKDKLFQQGTCIGSFYDDLEGNEELCMLRHEIFPHDVIAPPTVQIKKSSYTVTTGRNVTLLCTLTSNLSITDVYWQRNVNGIKTDIKSTTDTNKYSGGTTTTPSLTIFRVDRNDEGQYTCFASNSEGKEHSSEITLSTIQRFGQKCHDCDKEPSVYWCHNCQKSMCVNCNNHNGAEDTKDHNVQHEQDMYSLDYNIKINVTHFSDIKVLDDGLLVIADKLGYNQLVTYHMSEKQQHSIILNNANAPICIAVIDNNTVAVTVSDTVMIVDVRRREVKERIFLECCGIMCKDNQLFVGCYDRTIKVMNISGENTRTIKVDCEPKYICGGKAGRIFYSQDIELYCNDTRKNIYCSLGKEWIEPCGITADHEGNVLVICKRSYNVIKISPDGKKHQVIIKQIPPLGESLPVICYHLPFESIVIGHHGNVYVYKKE